MPKYVGELGEARLFTEKDLAGMYEVARLLREQDEHNCFLYVGIGRSPAILMEFMRQGFGVDPIDLPLSVSDGASSDAPVELTSRMDAFLQRYLPIERCRRHAVILIDYVDTGYSLEKTYDVVVAYLKSHGLHEEAREVKIVPLGTIKRLLQDPRSLLQRFDPGTKAARRMLKLLFAQLDKPYFAPFARIKYEQIQAGELATPLTTPRVRLQKVMALALEHCPMKRLPDSRYHEPARRDRDFGQVFRDFGRPGETKQRYLERLGNKSAREYDISSGFVSYHAWENRGKLKFLGVALFLFLAYLMFSWLISGSSSDVDLT